MHEIYYKCMVLSKEIRKQFHTTALREKCLNTEFFLARIFLYSNLILNTDQKKLRIWIFFTQCWFLSISPENMENGGIKRNLKQICAG